MQVGLIIACVIAVCVVLASSYTQAARVFNEVDGFYGGPEFSEWVPAGRFRFNSEHNTLWNAMQPVEVESQNFNSRSFMSGITWSTMADVLKSKIKVTNFPTEQQLNVIQWQRIKRVPMTLIDSVLINFMQATRFWYDNDLYIIALKVIHAHSSVDKKQYLLTIRLLLYRNGLMFGKVAEFTVFSDVGREYMTHKYTDVGIIGVVHQQHINAVLGIENITSSSDVHS